MSTAARSKDIARFSREMVRRFLESDDLRSQSTQRVDGHMGESKTQVLHFAEVRDETGWWLEAQDWGYDYDAIYVPETYEDLVRLRMKAQLGMTAFPKVAYHFYYELQRLVDEAENG